MPIWIHEPSFYSAMIHQSVTLVALLTGTILLILLKIYAGDAIVRNIFVLKGRHFHSFDITDVLHRKTPADACLQGVDVILAITITR